MIQHPLSGTPFGTALELCIALAMLCWILSVLTRDYCWVERLWTVVPAVYCLIVASDLEFQDARVNAMTVLVILWSIRLTFKLALKGGYRVGNEDYRTVYVRKELGTLKFQLFNVTVIALGNMIIVWMFTAPIHQAWLYSGQPLDWLDYLAAALFLVLLILESIADAQMWRFHQHKKQQMAAGIVMSEPFMADGLFRFCRHPNYFCEMGMWVTFYLFAISGSSQIGHWTGLGCVILILFFHGSTRFTEKISREKYATYSRYQATVPMFFPTLFPSKRRKPSPEGIS